MKKKFDISYFVVKEELPLTKYEKIIELKKRHGILHSSSYCYTIVLLNCSDQFYFMPIRSAEKTTCNGHFKCKIFSLLFDGTTDCAVVEWEAVLAIYFDPDPNLNDATANDGQEPMVKVQMGFLSVENLTSSTANRVVGGIKTALESLGLSNIGMPPPRLGSSRSSLQPPPPPPRNGWAH